MNEQSKPQDDLLDFLNDQSAESSTKIKPAKKASRITNDDEIVFRDHDGRLKVLRGNQVQVIEDVEVTEKKDHVLEESMGQPLKIEGEIQEVIEKSDLNFSNDGERNRLKTIIGTRLKGARNQAQTKETLLKPINQGGMGFDQGKSQVILDALATVADQMQEKQRKEVSMEPVPEQKEAEEKIEPQPADGKPIEDIKFESQLLGPIDELRTLSLVNFKRLGNDAASRTNAILNKIKILDQDSFSDRLKGIDAWRSCEVSKMYAEIGRQAIQEDKTVESIISQREQESKPTISIEEFKAIAALNQDLRRHHH